ncbi:hypothetical protein MBM_06909 [Drepanopeziza brunnea f. sp. 'multigermtubi' MB_m1]|uniref:Uncharacterized protein n=1 Tax=Marssonina brunnea f. sp. multigermtubi (strain MB_m1) TaxID=1072389 RepID=K1X1M0_MARBU|nr:uncharacterized protein MBM_06909 [Drepanopeziza brunnea f. sp. 'multigermtubi' MB_m1]EKD14698.1 hypothetical protein MBM_06909 [Drepanopeziza brunnea f. sp. 'multigermtubi' MB_m1]
MTGDNTGRGLKFATLISLKEHLLSKGTENLTDDEDNTPQPPPPPLRSPKGKERKEGEEIRRLREEFAKEKRDIEQNIKISVPNLSNPRREFSNPKKGSSTLGRTDKLLRSLNRLRIDKRDTKGIRIAKNAPKGTDITKLEPRLVIQMALAILTMTDEKETREISKEIEATDTEGDPGFGNELLKDLRRGRTTGNYIGNPLPIRPLARHNTPAYGTPSALDDNDNDFLELKATDLYLRAKELAFRYGLISDDYLAAFLIMLTGKAITFYYNHVIKARLSTFKANAIAVKDHFETDHRRKENPRTSLSECFEKLAKELKGIQGSLRPGLRDDRSLADKLYSACKNVPKTTIARMNLAFTFTAAIADIRRAIAFATKFFRPAKARAYASSSEPHDHTCS